ncbi:undecaprenyl-diphosphatase [Clostridium tetanomorphum]|uniref:Undecaprenyl-diphosphatase n=1 Tax=Clostridium tetanomorphum TaxID=1553 RepID=A0A923IZM4_CLOTT|nr:undecaprenyl-diphosphate phosphatase [Clostridium tetanomorphum]KAJ50900.1 undecaprenyl pyrophosphate phosphatase [Clostridium tetanomorphum DSM 665]MBC2397152.1 undecaprenyl-diphosphate phosphatase [Clostridium tetanomorphum]MBP1863074.1 undecaprenyl-diphosphatase [Clostridium tetanomorphum]NRS82903.1 undecaprenyl-diphosphatase [Clostridium tetanomorphum]NRZ99001.1 undecaprenyl-diphosphatase [Clostridium tetanomorphum]
MLLIIKSIVIAIIEGLTEFVPVSSTGHMILVGHLIEFKGDFANLFEIVIQLGAILAVVVLYWDKLYRSVKDIFVPGRRGLKFWINIVVAAFPAALLGFLLDDFIDAKLFNPITVAAALLVGGILMIVIENKYRRGNKIKSMDNIRLRQSFLVGLFQCLALWPGMSRSASTIMGGWIAGFSNVIAAEFSFFLAIPMMVGASGLKLIKSNIIMTNVEIIALVIGFVVAFIVSLIVIEKFIKFLQKKPMRIFAVYRIIVGAVLLIMAAFGKIS